MKSIQTIATIAGVAFTLLLLSLGHIPDYVGIGYLTVLAIPNILD